ncbi:unnamed protein product [Eruca vesicaria subsp. sativa]|uniref:Uncharacterized protein n=1 Tax=Eruca vesicaria subsp. sativa TaxID=29727 RepID=A0ABC8LZ23_ERUVS|nr:unnamed protein product [Eruca vesicaria subsp. sativa]
MNLRKHSSLISFINCRKNPYDMMKRQMTNYMLQNDETHQKWCIWLAAINSLVTFHLRLQPSCRPFPRTITAAAEIIPVMITFQSKQALIDEQIRSVQANASSCFIIPEDRKGERQALK